MNAQFLDNALAKIRAMNPDELFLKMYGYSSEQWNQYCSVGYEIDMLKAQEVLFGKDEVELYLDDTWNPSNIFIDYVTEYGIPGHDEKYWNGYGASYFEIGKFNLRLYIINGQGTVYILTHNEV